MKKQVLCIIMMLIPIFMRAEKVNIDGIYYNLITKGKVAEVVNSGYIGYYSGNVVIPNYVVYGGVTYSVISIGDDAFSYNSRLTSVTIPNSVTSIGNNAFQSCWGLTSLNIPQKCKSIGKKAFIECTSLTSLVIPNMVTSIEDQTFYGCNKLISVTIPNSVTSIRQSAFYGCI